MIVAPTRELVVQITQSLSQIAAPLGISIQSIYGGVSMGAQIQGLKRGAHIVVGTPGRLNDHLQRKTLSLRNLTTLVLDEADIMLDMGFKDEVDQLLAAAPSDRQIWLFSATIKSGIAQIMREHMKDTTTVRASAIQPSAAKTKQYYAIASMRERLSILCRFIDTTPELYAFVFCQTKALTAEVAQALTQLGYQAGAIHGDMGQAQRNQIIKRFKNKEFCILVATDVAARGIDVVDLTHVINYSIPNDHESYVHRIGRTGRAGKEGIAITFIGARDIYRIKQIEQKYKFHINPIDAPSVNDIAQTYLMRAIEHLTTLAQQQKAEKEPAYIQELRSIIEKYEHPALINALTALLSKQFFSSLHDKITPVSLASASEHEERSRSYPRGNRRGGGFDRNRRFGGGRGDRGGNRRFKRF